jgi:hypothetical protein
MMAAALRQFGRIVAGWWARWRAEFEPSVDPVKRWGRLR